MKRHGRMSRSEIIAAIQKRAAELGHTPSFVELSRVFTHISHRRVVTLFKGYSDAIRAAGLEASGPGNKASMEELSADWAEIVRKLGRIPGVRDYERYSSFSKRPLLTRFRAWSEVPGGILAFLEKTSTAGEWDDVVNVIKKHLEATAEAGKRSTAGKLWTSTPGVMPGRQEYGDPIMMVPGMANAPTTEMGVVLLFGMLARPLGFVVLQAQAAFPDCEVLRRMEQGRWQRMRIEFEMRSHSFLVHEHDPNGCDLVVCWEHNWPECPVEVLELKRVVEEKAVGNELG